MRKILAFRVELLRRETAHAGAIRFYTHMPEELLQWLISVRWMKQELNLIGVCLS